MTRKLLALFAGLALVACASGETTDTTEASAPTVADTTAVETTMADTTTAPPETTAAPEEGEGDDSAASATITMSNLTFSGATTVQVGEEIDLVNNDEVPHTFTDEDGAFDVSIPGGGSANYTFEEPGEYSYFCSIHPAMTGTINVEG